MSVIFTKAHVPDDLQQVWLQHMRDFDVAHPGCHFEVYADAPDASMAEVLERLQITPNLTFAKIFGRPK